jgi:hypothetical protein
MLVIKDTGNNRQHVAKIRKYQTILALPAMAGF